MSLKERWETEESNLGKFLKYVVGYIGMAGGVVMDMSINYMPYVKEYIPEGVSHGIFSFGLLAYGVSKLTMKKKEETTTQSDTVNPDPKPPKP